MKRRALITLVLCITIYSFVSASSWGMAQAGLALNFSPDSYSANPALLAISESSDRSFIASFEYQDAVIMKHFTEGAVNPFLVSPIAGWNVSFSAGNLAFSIENRNLLTQRTQFADYTQYDGRKTTLFRFDWAGKRSVLAFGVSARAFASSSRSSLIIRKEQTFLDYLVETTIGSYIANEEESNVTFGWGLLLDYDWFKMGVVSDTFASGSADEPLVISIDSLLKSLDWGFSLSSPTYDEANQLHLFKFEAALDLMNLGSDENRELRFGTSVKLQLLPQWAVHLLVGYRESKPTPSDLLRIDFSRGFQTIGLVGQLDVVRLTLNYGYPTSWYRSQPANISPKFHISLALAL